MRFGMDYGGTNVKAGVFGDAGEVLAFDTMATVDVLRSGEPLTAMVDFARATIANTSVSAGGLAIKGLVDTHGGMLVEDVAEGAALAGLPIRDHFADAFGCPFAVDNDARAYAWGEYMFGAGRGSTVLICMTLGTGVGCAVVAHGRLYEGANPLGGILGGHMSIDRNGPECPCGNRGCLELYCAAPAFKQQICDAHPELTSESDPLETFCGRILAGRDEYRPTLSAYQRDLAQGIINVIHAYGPDRVVIGGGVMESADVILPALRERVASAAWTVPRGCVKLLPASLGSHAAALGAAFHPGVTAKSNEQ